MLGQTTCFLPPFPPLNLSPRSLVSHLFTSAFSLEHPPTYPAGLSPEGSQGEAAPSGGSPVGGEGVKFQKAEQEELGELSPSPSLSPPHYSDSFSGRKCIM